MCRVDEGGFTGCAVSPFVVSQKGRNLVLFYAVVVDIQYDFVTDVAGVGVVVEVYAGVLLDVLGPDTATSTSGGFLFRT